MIITLVRDHVVYGKGIPPRSSSLFSTVVSSRKNKSRSSGETNDDDAHDNDDDDDDDDEKREKIGREGAGVGGEGEVEECSQENPHCESGLVMGAFQRRAPGDDYVPTMEEYTSLLEAGRKLKEVLIS